VLLGILLLFSFLLVTQISPVSAKENYYTNIEWLRNNGFDNSSFWISNIIGDTGDVDNSITAGEATFTIIGDEGGYEFYADPPLATNWTRTPDPEFILPDIDGINETGCYIGHEYLEEPTTNYFGVTGNQTRNAPSMTWEHQVGLPVNMSDYVIISASVSAVVNGSGDTNLETPGDTLLSGGYIGIGDFVRFYVRVADPNDIENYQIAYNKTITLGNDVSGPVGPNTYGQRVYLNDINLVPVDEDLLILYLTKVLQYDYTNFTIILGIDVYAEDNYPTYDRDTFYELRIKSFNLTFSYEKRINQFTTVSWSQTGNKIPAEAQILNASMSFEYRIDTVWPTASPNTVLQAVVNGKEYVEKEELPSFTTEFQQAEFSGITLKNLLATDVNITIILQLHLRDEFEFGDIVEVSIDNVSFKISYVIITQDPPPPNYLWLTAGLGGGLVILSIVFTAYQTIFKYPVFVRKIHSVRRKIRRGIKSHPLKILNRSELVNNLNKTNLNLEGFSERSL